MKKSLKSKWNWKSASALLTAALALAIPAGGQQLEAHLRLNGTETRKAFEPLRTVLQQSSAVIYDGYKYVAFGVVVSPDGYFVTKASEIEGIKEFTVRIDKKEYEAVEVLASTVEWDVALLRVKADDLVPVEWSDTAEPEHGTWVVSNGETSRLRRRVRVGIISANAREVGRAAPVALGVELDLTKEKLAINGVQEDSGAAEAGLKEGDVILRAEGREVAKIEDLQEVLKEKEPGDLLKLLVEREGEEKEFDVELRAREKIFEEEMTRNKAMSGRTSERWTNFKRILQHDSPGSERSMGGPLLDLSGRCVGLNIARANRSETFAIPAAEMLKIIAELFAKAK